MDVRWHGYHGVVAVSNAAGIDVIDDDAALSRVVRLYVDGLGRGVVNNTRRVHCVDENSIRGGSWKA